MMANTRFYWKALVGDWFLWGAWFRERWFVGVSRKF